MKILTILMALIAASTMAKAENLQTAIFAGGCFWCKAALGNRLGAPIVTPILAAGDFWDAETYHQNYYQKNANRYDYYRSGCGRDARVAALWGDEAPFANDH